MASPLLAGIPISSRFAEKLGIAQEKQDQQQMTHTKASTQDDKSWDATLYEKSDIYRSIKDAYTAPMRAWKGEIDPYSNEGVMEAINLAGVGMGGSIPGGAKGAGSLGVVDSPSFLKLFPDFNNTKLRGDTGDLKILYHGTSKDADFKNFKKSPRGTWLSESPEEASSYAMSNREYKDFFEPKVLEKIGAADFKSRSKVIEMPIDDFLNLAYPLEKPDVEKATNVAKILSTEKLKNPLYLQFNHEGKIAKVEGHEGRHRALALKAAGVKTVPVEVRSSRIRWSEQDDPAKFDYLKDWPEIIKSEDGKKTLPFFIKRGMELRTDGLNPITSPIEDLEASVKEQVKQLDSTGWDRLHGAVGKRDSDVQPTFLQKMYKEHPDLVKSKPSELEKLEIKLRRIYKLPEEEIEDIMLPLWSTYLRNQKPDDPAEEHTQKTKMKRWTENEESPLLTAVEKLAGMIEGMNKPRTVIRDKDGRIMGVA